jgi:hypothetical protein
MKIAACSDDRRHRAWDMEQKMRVLNIELQNKEPQNVEVITSTFEIRNCFSMPHALCHLRSIISNLKS